jgi:hypothetical protein
MEFISRLWHGHAHASNETLVPLAAAYNWHSTADGSVIAIEDCTSAQLAVLRQLKKFKLVEKVEGEAFYSVVHAQLKSAISQYQDEKRHKLADNDTIIRPKRDDFGR